MIRSNVGNIVTNGMQVLSVGATTASKLGHAENALNNLTQEERSNYYQMQADKIRSQMSTYQAGGESAMQHLSPEEQGEYRRVQADDIRKKIEKASKSDDRSIDELMGTVPKLIQNSEQVSQIQQKMDRDREWFANWYNNKIKGKNRITLTNKDKSEFLRQLKENKNNANV